MQQSALINVMSGAAIKAGKGLLRDFGEVDQLQISRKGTANFVTSADLRTEKLLQRELSKARPDFGFLLEEGGEVAGADADNRWIIDPLDGTTNFIRAIPHFCISIALEKRNRNGSEIVAGVVYDPIHNELFHAEKDKGAFLNSRRLMVSNHNALEDSLLVTGNPRRLLKNAPGGAPLLDKITQSGATIRVLGATALDLAHLAAGRIDGAWFYTFKPWDIAAGMLMVTEAGGALSDLEGKPTRLDSASLLATNGSLASPLRKLLAEAV